jgi:hypothetical protein
MSYNINKTDGSLLVELVDGTINTTSTDLTLVGRNYKGFGEFINENFVQLLENFASSNAPANPINGQLWYDTSTERLKIYNGSEFRVAGGPIISDTQPNMVAGDLWIDNAQQKLYFYDGVTAPVLVGPTYTKGQGKTGFEAYTMVDTSNQTRTVLLLYIGGVLAGIHSRFEFTPAARYVVAPFTTGRVIKVGFNPVDEDNFKYQGKSTSAEALVDISGNEFTSNDFVRTNERDESNNPVEQNMLGNLFVKGSEGVKVGIGDTVYAHFKTPVTGTTTVIETQESNKDLSLRVRKGSDFVDAIKIDTSESSVGIFQSNPSYNLDVTGDGRFTENLIVEGNLTVQGDASYFNVSTLRVEDKNIELGLLDDSTEGDDSNADGGGIILRSSGGSKDIVWDLSTRCWTINQSVNLEAEKDYRIENAVVLTKTQLGQTVTSAPGLISVGSLTSLSVIGDLTLSSNIVNAGPMTIDTGGTITISSQLITGLDTVAQLDSGYVAGGDPTDATSKAYVDREISTIPTTFSLDITGFTSPNPSGVGDGPIADVKNVLNDIAPVTSVNNGAIAKVHCVSYASATVSGINVTVTTDPDTSGTLTKSYVAVDSGGTKNESAVQDIAATNTTAGTIALTPSRYTMTFTVRSGAWDHDNTSVYT